jgi:hypothetical protein
MAGRLARLPARWGRVILALLFGAIAFQLATVFWLAPLELDLAFLVLLGWLGLTACGMWYYFGRYSRSSAPAPG